MKKLCVVFIVMFVLAMAGNANAEVATSDGKGLLTVCNVALKSITDGMDNLSDLELMNSSFCIGLAVGIKVSNVMEQASADDNLQYCIPSSASPEQLIRVLVKYLENHPENLHETPAVLISVAFIKAFPCKKGAKK